MLSKNARNELIDRIRNLPMKLTQEVSSLTDDQVDIPYRDEGWTIRQLVHHLADAHVNAIIRFKLMFTEDNPTLGLYNQDLWSELYDAKNMDIDTSLLLLTALHKKMVYLFDNLPYDVFQRVGYHPEVGEVSVDDLLTTYANHGDNHLAQLTSLKTKQGWK